MQRDKIRDIKWYLNVRVEMEQNIDDGRKEKVAPYFRSKTYTALANDDENGHNLNEAFQKMMLWRNLFTRDRIWLLRKSYH